MQPNATVLLLLTDCSQDSNRLILAYKKQLQDIAPSKAYWYNGYGNNGYSKRLFAGDGPLSNVKEWLVVAEDNEVDNYFEKLISNRSFTVDFNTKELCIVFELPDIPDRINLATEYERLHRIEGYPTITGSYGREYYSIKGWMDKYYPISIPLMNIDNINLITKLGKNSIANLYPSGVISAEDLKFYFTNNIVAVSEKRGVGYSLRGLGKIDKNQDPVAYAGYIQADLSGDNSWKVVISDLEDSCSHESEVSKLTGKWHVELESSFGKGIVSLYHKNCKEYSLIGREKFYIIKDISVDVNVVSRAMIDLYDREIEVDNKNRDNIKNLLPVSFIKKAYQADIGYNISVSDKIKELIIVMGGNLVVMDPYGLGDISIDGNQVTFTEGARIFLNAIVSAAYSGRIKNLTLLSRKSNIGSVESEQGRSNIDSYKVLFEKLKVSGIESVDMYVTREVFHDRHWLSPSSKIGVNVNTSISGFDQSEVRLRQLSDGEYNEVLWQYKEIIKNSARVKLL